MAVEAKRGCGYRKVGGLYLMSMGGGSPCCKMPLELTVCPCCGAGVKQARGWTWIDAGKMFPAGGCVAEPLTMATCPVVNPAQLGKVGLLWIGEKFYPRPVDFLMEAAKLGISRRMHRMPRGFKPNETWVLFAHPKAIEARRLVVYVMNETYCIYDPRTQGPVEGEEQFTGADAKARAEARAAELDLSDPIFIPGIIRITKPTGFELIVRQSELDEVLAYEQLSEEARKTAPHSERFERFERDRARGIRWVGVPDDDKDHVGSVYDKEEETE